MEIIIVTNINNIIYYTFIYLFEMVVDTKK